jgi:predicted transcriptional regulator YdeE
MKRTIVRMRLIFFAASALSLNAVAATAQTPADTVTHKKLETPFYVAGILVRTKNAAEANGQGKIGPLWQRFMQQNLARQIPHRADAAFTVVYCNYASDEKGDYDYLLGARVNSVEHLPAGMSWRQVEPATYAIFLTEKGPMPGVLQAEWARIWQMTPADLGGRRAFRTDYEIYDQRSANPHDPQIEIHIGLAASTK